MINMLFMMYICGDMSCKINPLKTSDIGIPFCTITHLGFDIIEGCKPTILEKLINILLTVYDKIFIIFNNVFY